MSLKIGTSNIADVYAGSTKISAIYKGSALVYSSGIYENLLFSNLYHSLIPSTIDTYSITEKSKAKLNKIYANGVIENQLVYLRASLTASDVTVANNGDGTITLNNTATSDNYLQISDSSYPISYVQNHKYLISGGNTNAEISASAGSITGTWVAKTPAIFTANASVSTGYVRVHIVNGTNYSNVVIEPQLIDLTLMFGTGNEPTTLTDNRIQALLKRGYIEYNTGTYRSTDMGEMISESYNMLDLTNRTQDDFGQWSNSTKRFLSEDKYYLGVSVNNYYSPEQIDSFEKTPTGCKMTTKAISYGVAIPVRVQPNTSYILSFTPTFNAYIGYFDKEGNYIEYTSVSNGNSFTTPNNCYWANCVIRPTGDNAGVSIEYSNICLHRTGTRTDYARHYPYFKNVSSMLGQRNTERSISTQTSYAELYRNWGTGDAKEFEQFTTSDYSHKFFAYSEIAYNASNTLTAMHFSAQGTVDSSYIIESHSKICSIIKPTNTSCTMYLYGTLQSTISLGKHILLDLTELGWDDMTAQQVYEMLGQSNINKLANGETLNEKPWATTLRFQGNGAINAHDTLEITSSEFVFTKNVGSVDLGTLTYGTSYTDVFSVSQMQNVVAKPSSYAIKPNAICPKYQTTYADNLAGHNIDKAISITPAGYIWIRDTSYSSTSDFKTAMSGVMLYYELATPQVITIPRKHLGVVDLGTLIWNEAMNYGAYSSSLSQLAKKPANNNTVPNIYCAKYTTSYRSNYANSNRMFITIDQSGDLDIEQSDLIGLTNKQIQAKLSGILLFYETDEAVADPVISTKFEIGGQLHSALFSWHKNQIIPNGDFSLSNSGVNTWYCQGTIYSIAFDSNTATVTKNASGGGLFCYKANADITYPTGHKYLAVAMVKPSRACNLRFVVSDYQMTAQAMTANVWNTLAYFVNPSSLTNIYFGMGEYDNSLQVNDTIQIKNVMLIDLTLGFGAGNEPTSIDDYRLAYLLKHGYIPTNTTGVYTHEDVEVLPNVEMRFGVTE